MKTIYTILICFLLVNSSNAQGKYLTKNGAVTFFSSALVEDIKADNNQVLSIIDASSGKMAISILMKSFQFEKALMQEHFNENYVESDTFPKATFKGDILNFESIKDSATKVNVKGTITIKIPSVVAKNIAKEIKVTFDFNHKPYKK